jgi:hypothetical protein
MARPAKGNVFLRPGGRFQASIPAEKGSTKRRYELFDAKAQAKAWRELAIQCLEQGLPSPSRDAVLADGDLSRAARKPSVAAKASPPIRRGLHHFEVCIEITGEDEAWKSPMNSRKCPSTSSVTRSSVGCRMLTSMMSG